jgi:hypothetical protein
VSVAPALFPMPLSGLYPVKLDEANVLLEQWRHRLGPVHRPFRSEAFALELDGRPLSVAVSASVVSATVAGYEREQVVELARLGSDPTEAWATRIMLRLWREVCAPRWHSWQVQAAISYSHNAMHRGDIYRFDGWKRIRDDCGSSGGGSWSRPRYATDVVHGRKTLWLWRYE